jgi:hypothetical protein
MIIDITRMFAKPRRGVMIFQVNYVIPTGFGDSALQFYNPFIPSGLLTA